MAESSARKISSFSKQEITQLRAQTKHIYAAQGLKILAAFSFSNNGRILIIIPRTSGNAVKRNLIRRRIKAIFYQEQFIKDPYNYVIIIKKTAINLSYQEIKEYMLKAKFKAFEVISHS